MIYLKQSYEANICKPIINNVFVLQHYVCVISYLILKVILSYVERSVNVRLPFQSKSELNT